MNRTTITKSLQNLVVASALVGSIAVPAFAGTAVRNADLLAPAQAQYHSDAGDIAAIALGVLVSALEADRRRDVSVDDPRRDRHDRRDDNVGRGPGRGPGRDDDDYGRGRDDDDYGRGRGPGRDRGDRWGRGGRGRHQPQFACYAENGRRQVFSAIDRDPNYAQNEAVRSCYRVSRRCRPIGCREIR